MSQTLEQIRQYWNSRAEGYTLSNREELEDEHRIFLWEQQIRRALNGRICRHVLDVMWSGVLLRFACQTGI